MPPSSMLTAPPDSGTGRGPEAGATPDDERARLLRRAAWTLGTLTVVLVLAFSNSFGRAEPTGNYRPELLPDTMELGCYPLPEGVELDLSTQVRLDRDVPAASGERRELTLQWNRLDVDEAAEALLRSFTRAGFTVVEREERAARVSRPGTGEVAWVLTPLDVDEDTVVRGTAVLDLPVVALASDDPHCTAPSVTKRFEETR